jgi:site-specific DNA recombinase
MTVNINYPDNITALYACLSQEDALDGESNSIANQKKILLKYATDNSFPNPTFFIDDGVSGVTFDRPGWNEMIRLVEAGKVKTVIVKDMSRMGRDYLKVGYYTESFFSERDIRYIAINDGVDSDKGDNDFTPFRNLFNDFYARDTSKKIRAVMRAKGNAGEHLCTNPPYGYMKDPADKKKWIVDEEAAKIVKRIFDLCIAGKGPMQIAKLLTAQHVLTVKAHYAQRDGKPLPEKPYQWSPKSVAGILERPEYTGCTVNFKTYSKSHKLKKRLHNAPENQRIFSNTQPAIIDEQVFARVQELRENKRRPAKQAERQGLFSGLLYCADCGSKLHFATGKNMTPQQDCYRCSRYKSNTGDCTMHFIREETLKQFVLQRIFDVTALFFDDAMAFEEAAKKQRFQEADKEAKRRKRESSQAEKRIAELDRIFKRIYEDDISGAISHERFLKLSADYEAEQKELTEQVKTWREAVETFEQDQADFASFAAIVRKYVGIRELTPTIVNEFVKKIIVYAPDKSSGHRRQKVELVWNFIGEVNLPGDDQTVERQRKGRTA